MTTSATGTPSSEAMKPRTEKMAKPANTDVQQLPKQTIKVSLENSSTIKKHEIEHVACFVYVDIFSYFQKHDISLRQGRSRDTPDDVVVELVVASQRDESSTGDAKRVKNLDGRLHPDVDVAESVQVWHHVKPDALGGAWQCHAANQQDDEHQVGEQRREVHHLRAEVKAGRQKNEKYIRWSHIRSF